MDYTYPTPSTVRLDKEEREIIQRMKDAAPAGAARSLSDCVRMGLHAWADLNPVNADKVEKDV